MTRLLVTGFEPFGPFRENPSALVLELLPDRIAELAIDKLVLPVETEGVKPVLARLHAEPYLAVLHLGLAQDRTVLTVERRAVNLLDFTIIDNRGIMRQKQPIVPEGPELHAARLPVDAILSAWLDARIPAAPSDSAGTFLCNQVMYTSLHSLPESVPTGFIHLPPHEVIALPEQARAIELALSVIAREL